MERLLPITKSTPLTTTISKILDHFTLDPHVQLTEITKAPPITIQAEGPACPRAVSIVEIAVRKLEGMFPFFLIYQYNLVTQVEKKVKVGGQGDAGRKGKSKSRVRMLKKREKRRAKRKAKSEIRREHHSNMRAITKEKERDDAKSWLLEKLKRVDDGDGENIQDEGVDATGPKRKRDAEVSDDADDLFESAAFSSSSSSSPSSSSSSDDEDAKM
ncbi:hypothetical protein V1517DRAFT_202581 [Lipomyces orientalis]|uniref:Uncharacterized protein n=1 Tax=Lipomyces orientalis TaxID=1233043 RepID=A0ACC3TWP5_9ASCO